MSTTESSSENSPQHGSFFARRLSSAGASLLTLSSIDTVLPQYTADDIERTIDDPPAFEDAAHLPSDHDVDSVGRQPTSAVPSNQAPLAVPFQNAVVNLRRSVLLTPSTTDAVDANSHLAGRYQRDSYDFKYSYPIKSGNSWATLKLQTRDPVPGNPKPSRVQPKVPRIWSFYPLKGVICLDLDGPQVIQCISVILRGKSATSSMHGASLQFMTHEFTVWDKSFGHPKTNYQDNSSKENFDGKFVGKYSFPFSFPFPTHVDPSTKSVVMPTAANSSTPSALPDLDTPTTSSPSPKSEDQKVKKKQQFSWPRGFSSPFSSSSANGAGSSSNTQKKKSTSRSSSVQTDHVGRRPSPLPQTFTERGLAVMVSYELSVHFVHGRFKPDSRIKTGISYLPALQPFSASLKRRQAYEAAARLPSPFNDPDGWFSLAEVPIVGLFDGQDNGRRQRATINCKLYLAEPLSYTRGAAIPCFLTLSSDDEEALQWLASPEVPVVRLMRHIHHFVPQVDPYTETQMADLSASHMPRPIIPCVITAMGEHANLKMVSHEVATAVWWRPPKDVTQETFIRHLEGEIHLSPDLQPSCASEIFRVEYIVELLSLQSAYFELEPDVEGSTGKRRIQQRSFASVPVEVTTLYRQDEPVPVPFSERPKIHQLRDENE